MTDDPAEQVTGRPGWADDGAGEPTMPLAASGLPRRERQSAGRLAAVGLLVLGGRMLSVCVVGAAMASDGCGSDDPRRYMRFGRPGPGVVGPLFGWLVAVCACCLLLAWLPRRPRRRWAVFGCWLVARDTRVAGVRHAPDRQAPDVLAVRGMWPTGMPAAGPHRPAVMMGEDGGYGAGSPG